MESDCSEENPLCLEGEHGEFHYAPDSILSVVSSQVGPPACR
jgi:hypothetical protein